MENNKKILAREIVVIDSRKRIGNVKGLRIDCDTLSVGHYLINNTITSSMDILPFSGALNVGNTFITVQNLDDFIPSNDPKFNAVLQDGYVLLEAEVFSKAGNRLGTVKGFEFDTVYGTVTKIELEDQTSFTSDTFIFFSPEFVFVDDGEPTADELRSGGTQGKPAPQITHKDEKDENKVKRDSVKEEAEVSGVPEVSAAVEKDDVLIEVSGDDESLANDEIRDFLQGLTLNADVESEDGEFKVAEGVVLTKEIIEDAEKHDALLLLTINVDA